MTLPAPLQELESALGGAAEALGHAPGRINTIGGHTDYIEGLALSAAIDRRCHVALRRSGGPDLEIHALDLPAHGSFALNAPPPNGSWARGCWGAVEVFSRHHGAIGGLEAAIRSTVPQGAGVSSSAALTVAWLAALAALQGLSLSALELARLAQEVEHRWLGVPCGLLDPLTSAAGAPGALLAIDFRAPVRAEPVHAALPGSAWLLLDTGVRRTLAESGYAQRVAEVTAGRAAAGGTHWRELQLSDLARVEHALLRARLRHGITENARVRDAIAAARAGDAPGFGALLFQSHASLRDDYAVSWPEADHLVERARGVPGVYGARMMGGGFGGCVVALVAEEGAASARARMLQHGASSAWIFHPGEGAGGQRLRPG